MALVAACCPPRHTLGQAWPPQSKVHHLLLEWDVISHTAARRLFGASHTLCEAPGALEKGHQGWEGMWPQGGPARRGESTGSGKACPGRWETQAAVPAPPGTGRVGLSCNGAVSATQSLWASNIRGLSAG